MNALQLCESWEERARRKFFDATHEIDPNGRRLIEHGAMCYFNAAAELRQQAGLPALADEPQGTPAP